MTNKVRGFEPVQEAFMQNTSSVITEDTPSKRDDGNWVGSVQLPVRSDARSAGYDFHAPRDLTILPAQKLLVWTDVKAYMQDDEVLTLLPRSSMGIKKGLMLSNTMGVIDASYYENESNDGNIGLSLLNTTGKAINIKKGERIVQGVFSKFLITDADAPTSETRTGGIGSSGA
jgi:dUTP pyrophosphatase